MTKRASGGSDDEAALFAAAMQGATRLKGPVRVVSGPPPRKGRRAAVAAPPVKVSPSLAEAPGGPVTVEAVGEAWSARANGIDRRLVRRLGGGQMPIEARIDLHGRTREEALRALDRFVAHAAATELRCLLVIHGRGLHSTGEGPTLRDAVREALTSGPLGGHVLASTSAPPALGGPGATVLWLRRAPSETGR